MLSFCSLFSKRIDTNCDVLCITIGVKFILVAALPRRVLVHEERRRVSHKILIIDDDVDILTVLQTHCELMGYSVATCEDPLAALERIKTEKFHIVLLDINMPKMSGVELLKAIKSAKPTTQVIMITAFTTVEKTIDCWEHGASDYILKPFTDLEQIGVVINLTSERIRRWEEIYKQSM